MQEEAKRKVCIAVGGLQAVWRAASAEYHALRHALVQYILHRVLRWAVTP